MIEEVRYVATNESNIYKRVVVSPEYIKCEDEVDRICFSVKKLIQSIVSVFADVVPTDVTGQMRNLYKECLVKTITIASDDVDKLIVKHHVTNQFEIDILKEKVTDLWDNAGIILCQG